MAYALIVWTTGNPEDQKRRFALRAIRNVGGIMVLAGLLVAGVAGFTYTFNVLSTGLAQTGTALILVLLLVLGTIGIYKVTTKAR